MLSAPAGTGGFDLVESSYDNAGNVIHAEAPFSFWDDGSGVVMDAREIRRHRGASLRHTIDFANRKNATYVLSAANFIQFEGFSEERRSSYDRLRRELERLDVPLVVLGLGVQAPRRWNPRDHRLPSEAVELMKFLGDRCKLVSVRGEFSASVLRDYAGVRNSVVTGCPSFFQDACAFESLYRALPDPGQGLTAFSVTNLSKPAEVEIFRRALDAGHTWVDVRHPDDGGAMLRRGLEARTIEAPTPPDVEEVASAADLSAVDRRHFVDYRSWIDFARRSVRFGYGTRLHANMALLLAGKPALWIVHDSRTIEATNALCLPTTTLQDVQKADLNDLERAIDYTPMFDNLTDLFARFNQFLELSGLPQVEAPFSKGRAA